MSFHLEKSQKFERPKGPVVLLVMDGVGLAAPSEANAVTTADTPCLDQLMTSPLYTELKAHGTAVGMPTDQDMGNSEVGHNALGAGRVFHQGAALVQEAICSGRIFDNEVWNHLSQIGQSEKTIHLIGLLSEGNVHAHYDHLAAIIEQAMKDGIRKLRCHCLLDGRDVPPRSALGYLEKLEALLDTANAKDLDYAIASGGGRMLVTMDRYDADWEMVKRGWETHVLGKAKGYASAKEAVEAAYQDPDIIDQYIPPFVIEKEGDAIGKIQDGDGVLFFNFRGDRAIELSKAFEEETFTRFDRGGKGNAKPDLYFAGMMEYDGDLHIPENYLVSPPQIEGSVSDYFSGMGLRSFAISETQKYGHVTYFWNGNRSGYINEDLEDYHEIPSDPRPFHEQPEMRAPEITEETIRQIQSGGYDFIRVNYPNGDMIGHTGDFGAVVKSVEVTDACVQKVIEAVNAADGVTVVLSDHGNAEEMFSIKNGVKTTKTAHTLNPVPFCIIDERPLSYSLQNLETPGLANVAATLCNLLGFEAPEGYEASLIQ